MPAPMTRKSQATRGAGADGSVIGMVRKCAFLVQQGRGLVYRAICVSAKLVKALHRRNARTDVVNLRIRNLRIRKMQASCDNLDRLGDPILQATSSPGDAPPNLLDRETFGHRLRTA